jgi:hypothetical protein
MRRSALVAAAAATALIAVFTKSAVYSIITLLGAGISIGSFMITVKLTDRFLKKGRGKALFFSSELAKAAAIVLYFVFWSPHTFGSTAAFVLGLSAVVVAALAEGARQLLRPPHRHGT